MSTNLINVRCSERIACYISCIRQEIALTKVRGLRRRSELLTWLHVQLLPAAHPARSGLPITH